MISVAKRVSDFVNVTDWGAKGLTGAVADAVKAESGLSSRQLVSVQKSISDPINPDPDTEILFFFDQALDVGETTAFDAAVAAFTGVPAELKVKDHMATVGGQDHRQIDYKTGLISRLHRKIDSDDSTFWHYGEVRKVEYYSDIAFTDLVISVVIEYVRNPDGTLLIQNPDAVWGDSDFIGRRVTRTWYRKDGTAHPDTKVTYKTYNKSDTSEEGERRRSNVIKDLKVTILGLLTATGHARDDGVVYIDKYDQELNTYERTDDLSWKTSGTPNITSDTEPWLDADLEPLGYPAGTTTRAIILSKLGQVTDP